MRQKVTELQTELIDAYAYEMSVASISFEFMGRLLDADYVKKRVQLLGLSEIFIYGGGYLGIQFYNAVSKFVQIVAMVDKKGRIQFDISNVSVMDIRKMKENYNGEKVIIASVRFYKEIKRELLDFVPETQIMFLGEFLGGML